MLKEQNIVTGAIFSLLARNTNIFRFWSKGREASANLFPFGALNEDSIRLRSMLFHLDGFKKNG